LVYKEDSMQVVRSTIKEMGNRARGALYVALLCAALASLAGCAVLRGTPTPEPASITFAYPQADSQAYQALMEEFNERYPHITVELRPKRYDMLGGISAGDADIFVSSQFALNWLQGENQIRNLTPLIEQDENFDRSDYYPGTLELYTREGEVWAIPAGVDVMVMYTHKDLFEAAGVPEPQIGWNWDDFYATTLQLRDPVADVYGYAPSLDLFDPLTFIYQHGGRIFDDLENPSRTAFDDPLTVEALEWYAGLIFEENVAPTPEQSEAFGRGGVRAGIYRDKVALWTGMLSERGGRGWPTEWPMRWGVTTLPRDQAQATLTLVEGYYISAQTDYPDAAWAWLSFVSGKLPNRHTPVRRSLAEGLDYEEKVGAEVAAVARASLDGALLLSPELAEFEDALGLFEQAFRAIMDQRSTPMEAMNWAQQQSRFK
jgi:multiple sugar transport system substrate-binding protein